MQRKITYYFCLSALFLLFPTIASAQSTIGYNLNTNNELPENHVYSGLTDQYGYLWLCTPKGVVRYNGYESKYYNVADGLINSDVWGLTLDNKNRIWLHSIANGIGYIYNEKYYRAHSTKANQEFYPKHIGQYGKGIIFASTNVTYDKTDIIITRLMSVEKNDTVRFIKTPFEIIVVNNKNNFAAFAKNKVYLYSYDTSGLHLKNTCNFQPIWYNDPSYHTDVFYNEYIFFYKNGTNTLKSYNLKKCTNNEVNFYTPELKPDNILTDLRYGGYYYIVAQHSIYKLDGNLNIIAQTSASNLYTGSPALNPKNITYYFPNDLWGAFISTNNNGIYLSLNVENGFEKVATPSMGNYKLVGTMADSLCYWWNNNTKTLLTIDKNEKIKMCSLPEINSVNTIATFSAEKSFLITRDNIYLFNHKTLETKPVNETHDIISEFENSRKKSLRINTIKSIISGGDRRYLAFTYGIEKFTYNDSELITKPVIDGNYSRLLADKVRNGIWGYSNSHLVFFSNDGSRKVQLNNNALSLLGIRHIEVIQVDTIHGNILLNDGNNILYADFERGELKKLFHRYNLRGCKILVKGNTIICAGDFGALFSRIEGKGKFSVPVVYPNTKGAVYQSLHEIAAVDNKLFLKTDKGMFKVNFPLPVAYKEKSNYIDRYVTVVKYKDSIYTLSPDKALDLSIDQKYQNVSFDIINPFGSGKLIYSYHIEGGEEGVKETDNNEIFLPQLQPGKSYTLSLTANDDVWRSKTIRLRLYVVPYWWQRPIWQDIFWISGALLIVLFTYIVVAVTRKIVNRRNAKKNELLELELRAVYAQINPHFIFNTLNSALYFISRGKLKEAYDHVFKFSRLLRGYLESSKNRHISLVNEVRNLQNYIALQQTRFENLFTYEITLQNIPDPDNLYIPSLLLQPLVENAINHGLAPKGSEGELNIMFAADEEKGAIVCTIEDNGIGRSRAAEINKSNTFRKTSQGSLLLEQLTDVFNKYEKTGIQILYSDKEPPFTGTIVKVKINKPYYETQ